MCNTRDGGRNCRITMSTIDDPATERSREHLEGVFAHVSECRDCLAYALRDGHQTALLKLFALCDGHLTETETA